MGLVNEDLVMHSIYPFFSSPVYKSEINPLPIKDFDHIINNIEYAQIERGVFSKNKYILEDPELQELKSHIINHFNTYLYQELKILKSINLKLLNSWVVKSLPNTNSDSHIHANSLFSGVVYIKTHENCWNITFKHSTPNIFSNTVSIEYSEFNMFNSSSWSISPYDGLILLFPSNLAHQIDFNLSNYVRYSLAFNAYIEGDIGNIDDMNCLSIK